MKKYFNCADVIIIVFSCISIAWIIGYKFFWFDMEPLFSNADKTADITYTICTSVVASGLFYLFTIFIPKYYRIKKISKIFAFRVSDIDDIINTVIGVVNNSKTNNKYDYNSFTDRIINNRKDLEQDFISHYSNKDNIILLNKLFNIVKYRFVDLVSSYKDILLNHLIENINYLCNCNYSIYELNEYLEENENQTSFQYRFDLLCRIIAINNKLKEIYLK